MSIYIIFELALPKIDPDFALSLAAKANHGEKHSRHITERHAWIEVTVSTFMSSAVERR